MASVYPKAKEAFLSAALDLTSINIKIVLLGGYAYSDSHQFLTSLSGSIVTSGNLTNKTVSNGVFDADDVTLPTVPVGHTVTAIVGYNDTGTASTSDLLFCIDGFSQDTSGGDITVQWDNDSSVNIFAL